MSTIPHLVSRLAVRSASRSASRSTVLAAMCFAALVGNGLSGAETTKGISAKATLPGPDAPIVTRDILAWMAAQDAPLPSGAEAEAERWLRRPR